MGEPEPRGDEGGADAVADYKRILAAVLDRMPSGTRQRLAAELGINRSFVSQISNPAYATPIPAGHVETILEVCHFVAEERASFLAAYARAHPGRPVALHEHHRQRTRPIHLPDFGDDATNEEVRALVSDFISRLKQIFDREKKP